MPSRPRPATPAPCGRCPPQAAREENLEIDLPDDLVRVERVGQFTQLVELTEASQELKHKVRGCSCGKGSCVGMYFLRACGKCFQAAGLWAGENLAFV